MIKLAVEKLDGIEFSDFELSMNETTYTADTLHLLKELHPEDEFFFIMGSDSIIYFLNWYRPDVILKYATLLVAKRKDSSSDKMKQVISSIEETYNVKIGLISMDSTEISSSYIRTHSYGEIQEMVPKAVYEYIVSNRLYNNCNVNSAWSVNQITDHLSSLLKPARFTHTLGVATTAKAMAERFGVNPNKAYMAGILHDCAKYLSEQELLDLCRRKQIPITETEREAPYLLHAKAGAYFAEHRYHITDEEILSAIRWHTTGKPDMSRLEQIIFCADYIEPGRTRQPDLEFLRKLSGKDLECLTYHILKDTVCYLKENSSKTIDAHTLDAYTYYSDKVEGRSV